MTRRRRSHRSYYLPLGCIIPPIILAGLLLAAYLIIPLMAMRTFGPPVASLGRFQYFQYSLSLLWHESDLTRPADPAGVERAFPVASGEGAAQVADRLETMGLIRSADAFRAYLVYTGMDTTLQAGEFTISPALTPMQIAIRLQDATPAQIKFGVLPGWRLEEIAQSLPTSGLNITPEAFLQATRSIQAPYDFFPQGASLEGFVLAKEYVLPRTITVDDLVNRFLQDFAIELTPALREAFQKQGLSVQQAVTLASIVQREAIVADEQPTIASVFLNRLSIGMKLESDPTVQYAVGFDAARNTWWTNPLSAANLQFDSPYNTYLYAGLPPGPISSPTLGALNAVAYPAQTPYFYFRAACDGSGRHAFAQTYDQHLANGCP